MAGVGRVVTAKLPEEMISRMDEIVNLRNCSKSWIVRQAVAEWLAEERRRDELTLEALRDVDEGRTFSHEDVIKHFASRRASRPERV